MEKSWNFVKEYDKTTSSQKTSCRTHVCPTASFHVCRTASFLASGGVSDS